MLSLLGLTGSTDRGTEATTTPKPKPQRPSIGLALGGGAARGFAHIGVIRTLLANGIEPDVIVGTSIGAVVGACYAAGQIDAFEEWGRSLTKRGVLGYLDISLGGSGLIGGERLATRLDEALGERRIEDLPRHFAAIATELGTGHEIWLTHGTLVEALRASYALPGIFTPVHLGGRWLVDGALVNPVPVSAARALGARLVIAVNVNSDLLGHGSTIASHGSDESDERARQEARALRAQKGGLREMFSPERLIKRHFLGGAPGRPNIASVMVDAFNIMQDRVTRSRLAGDPPDVLVSPRLGSVGLFDFHLAKEAIAIGAHAAERALEEVTAAVAALG